MKPDPLPSWLNTKPAQVAIIDEKLKLLRDGWIDSRPAKKQSWLAKLDEALDQRIALMP